MSYSHSLAFDDTADIKTFTSGLCMGKVFRTVGQMIWDKSSPKDIKGNFKSIHDFDIITDVFKIEDEDLIPTHMLPSGQEVTFPMSVEQSFHVTTIATDFLSDFDYIDETMKEIRGTPVNDLKLEAINTAINAGYKDFISKLKGICKHFGDLLDKEYAMKGINAITHMKDGSFRIVGYFRLSTDEPEGIYLNPEFLADYFTAESAVEKATGSIAKVTKMMGAVNNSTDAYRNNQALIDSIDTYREDVLSVSQNVKAFSNGFILLQGGDPNDMVLESPVAVQIDEPELKELPVASGIEEQLETV
jgi:hypothetical protein